MAVLFFLSAKKKFNRASVNYIDALDQLQKSVFLSCQAQKDQQNKNYYAQKIHQARLRLFHAINKVRLLASQDNKNRSARFENFYEIIFSFNILTLRITDPATLDMCEADLKKMSHDLSEVLKHIILLLKADQQRNRKLPMDRAAQLLAQFSRQIDMLEELYRSALQVVLPEPIYFMFFIQDLMALRDAIESFLLEFLHD